MTWLPPETIPPEPGVYAVLRKEGRRYMFRQTGRWWTPIYNNHLQHVGWSCEPAERFWWHEVDPNQSIQPHDYPSP